LSSSSSLHAITPFCGGGRGGPSSSGGSEPSATPSATPSAAPKTPKKGPFPNPVQLGPPCSVGCRRGSSIHTHDPHKPCPYRDPKPLCPIAWNGYTRQWVLRNKQPAGPRNRPPVAPVTHPHQAPRYSACYSCIQRQGDQGERGNHHMGALEHSPPCSAQFTWRRRRDAAAAALI
jgi:hypothetical protein